MEETIEMESIYMQLKPYLQKNKDYLQKFCWLVELLDQMHKSDIHQIIDNWADVDKENSAEKILEVSEEARNRFFSGIYTEITSMLIPFFPGKNLSSTDSIPFADENPELKNYKYVWDFNVLGHFTGKHLFQYTPGLKEALMDKLTSAFDDREQFLECLKTVFPGEKIKVEDIPQLMNDAMYFYTTDQTGKTSKNLLEDYFIKILNHIKPGRNFNADIAENKAEVKIEFLKYLWLHWLENAFADIINLVVWDASSIFTFIHEYKFFGKVNLDISPTTQYNSEKELIDHFFNMDNCYPIYFRFRFMLSTLAYIEQRTGRKYLLADKIRKRFQPIINILLEKNDIKGNELDNYRFQKYILDNVSFSLKIDLVERMHEFIIKKIFECIDDFVKKQGIGDWLQALAFKDWELGIVDDLVYKMTTGEKDIVFSQYRHIQVAGRYAFELFPRKAIEINHLSLTAIKKTPTNINPCTTFDFSSIDYFYNREYYWDWHIFNQELDNYLSFWELLPAAAARLDKNYRSPDQYSRIIAHIKELLPTLDAMRDRHKIKKIKIMLLHYSSFWKVQQYNIALETNMENRFFKKEVTSGIIQEIMEHDIFHLILDMLTGTNYIKIEFLLCLEEVLISLSKNEYKRLPKILSERYAKIRGTLVDIKSLMLLYECGDMFNHQRYLQAISDWYENLENIRQIHQEAWKGKIIARIKERIFNKIKEKIVDGEWINDNDISIDRIEKWQDLFGKIPKSTGDTELLLTLTYELEIAFMKKILSSDIDSEVCIRIIIDSIKAVCTETLLWIHYKNVRYINNRLIYTRV